MPKQYTTKREIPSMVEREKLRALYYNNIYNIYMTSHEWEGLNYQQQNYIMRKFWTTPGIALFPLKHMEEETEESSRFCLAPFSVQSYNNYDYPVEVTFINERGVPFIPNTPQRVDRDCVICYIQPSKKNIGGFVDIYIDKIVNAEMVLQLALNVQKMPFLLKTNPETKREIESLWNALQTDNPKLFVSGDYAEKDITAFVTGAPYIVDKIKNYVSVLWNDLLTFIGVNNLGINEKKEHLVTSEVEANNDYVEASGSCFTDYLKDFCERVNKLFGYHLNVVSKAEKRAKSNETTEEVEDDGEDMNENE